MASKLFRLLAFMVLSLFLLGTEGVAASPSAHKLNYFQTSTVHQDGRDVLRIEIGVDGDGLEYTARLKDYVVQRLAVDLEDTNPGKLRREIPLKSDLAKRVTIRELGPGRTQVGIDLAVEASEDSYRVYTEKANRREKKPYRLVIEITRPAAAAPGGLGGLQGHTVVLDPGHGGSDSGAVGPHGVTEKSVTLSVAKKVQSILKASGTRVIMTRETDRDVYAANATDRQELQARVNVGLRVPEAEIFLSIHCNAFSNPAAHGMETYHCPGAYGGGKLATILNEELERAGGLFNRGVKTANFYVMRHSKVPASLIELGFITNYREEALLSDDEYQNKLAMAIAKGISRYFQE